MELNEYKKLIKQAKTKQELQEITLLCLKETNQNINSKKYNQVIKEAINQEIKLGL